MMTVGGYTILKGSVLAIDTSNIVMVVRRRLLQLLIPL